MVQPIMDQVVQAVIGVLASVLIGAVLGVGRRVTRWLDSKTTASERELLHKLAAEAVAFAKVVFKDQDGQEKLEAAMRYVNARLSRYGVRLTEQELRGAVEKAYLEYKAKTTQPAAADPVTVEVPVEKPLAPEVQQLIDAAKAVAGVQQATAATAAVPAMSQPVTLAG